MILCVFSVGKFLRVFPRYEMRKYPVENCVLQKYADFDEFERSSDADIV